MTEAWRPQRPIEIVAGTPPGGGLDRSARALLKAIETNRLVDVPIKVVNVGGDGGRRAWAHMEGYAGDGHVIGISSPNMAADYLTGVTKSDPDRFPPLAILYSEYIAFVVRTDAGLDGGAELVQRFAQNAAGVTVALSTSLGNSNHVAVAKVIRHAGGDTRAPKTRVFDTALDAVADVVAECRVGAIGGERGSGACGRKAAHRRHISPARPRLRGRRGSSGADCVIGSGERRCRGSTAQMRSGGRAAPADRQGGAGCHTWASDVSRWWS